MLHLILLGFIVGFSFAMSVGPIFLLIVRVNLQQGFWRGMMIGFGAVAADFTYLFLLATGALFILNQAVVLKVVGLVGAVILLYFGIKTMRTSVSTVHDSIPLPKLHRHFFTGYFMCLSSPLSILFWAGMAGTIAGIAAQHNHGIYIFGLGFFIGVIIFLCLLNGTLVVIRHKLSNTVLNVLNKIGGLSIIGFGLYGLLKVL